jgi:hypothetical protein
MGSGHLNAAADEESGHAPRCWLNGNRSLCYAALGNPDFCETPVLTR